jgi:mannose-1-phosphate guanylyltransferase / phosphomannomutase
MLKRAMISGLNSTGVDVADLRVSPPAISRHVLKTQGFTAAIHVGAGAADPEMIQIRIFEPPGIQLTGALEKEIEKHFTRGELRRMAFDEIGKVNYPARVRESYAQDVLDRLDCDVIRERGFRIVVDQGYSAASFVLPLVGGPMGVETVTTHGFFADTRETSRSLAQAVGHTKRIVTAVGADLGAVFDRSAERIALIDEHGQEIAVEQTLLLFLRLLVESGAQGTVAVPVTVTHQVEAVVDGSGLQVQRTQASLAALTRAAAEDGIVFAGAVGGGYVFPEFTPAYDAVATLCKLLELLAPSRRPLSELVAELPRSTRIHRQLACPWGKKGLVMRVLNERLQGREVDLLDGIKVFNDNGWAQVLPDPDEPLVHLYAEGATPDDSETLEAELEAMVVEIMQGDEARPRTLEKASS